METLGFIILRHVNSHLTDKYWKLSYDCIRKYYPENEIVIIDDNSDSTYLTYKELYKTQIVETPFAKRGELLPYLYFAYNKPFDIACIIHDSVFINSHLETNVDEYNMLWDFQHFWDQPEDEIKMIHALATEHPELIDFYHNKELWKGCFGGMTIIRHDYLVKVNAKYNIDVLSEYITTRYNRSSFERILACILQIEKSDKSITSVFGDIHQYIPWGVPFDNKHHYMHLPIIKVWTGR